MKKNYKFFDIKRGSRIYMRKILSDTTLIMLERTMYLAIILLLVRYRFQSHWSDGKHNAKVRAVNQSQSRASQYKCPCKMFCNHCCTRKYMNSFCDTYLSLQCIDLYFLCEYLLYLSAINFTPFIRVLVIKTQSLVMLICIWLKQIEKRTSMFHALRERKIYFWSDLVLA